MRRFGRFLELCIKLPIGLLLYLFSRRFRAVINAKLRGANDPVQTGEEVIAVLNSGQIKKTIGGKK